VKFILDVDETHNGVKNLENKNSDLQVSQYFKFLYASISIKILQYYHYYKSQNTENRQNWSNNQQINDSIEVGNYP